MAQIPPLYISPIVNPRGPAPPPDYMGAVVQGFAARDRRRGLDQDEQRMGEQRRQFDATSSEDKRRFGITDARSQGYFDLNKDSIMRNRGKEDTGEFDQLVAALYAAGRRNDRATQQLIREQMRRRGYNIEVDDQPSNPLAAPAAPQQPQPNPYDGIIPGPKPLY